LQPKEIFLSQPITATIKCPSCGETLLYGVTQCRFCGNAISESYAKESVVSEAVLTHAVKSANIIRSLRALLYFLLAMTVFACLWDRPYLQVLVILSFLNLIAPVRWLRKYGGLGANSEIIKARKEMKIEFGLWLAVSIFQAIAILIWLLRNRAIQQALGADSP
jgi:NADH:ubiquinone oxidoreductase subunit 6 (subunit J)